MIELCKIHDCQNTAVDGYCSRHSVNLPLPVPLQKSVQLQTMAQKYPKYYKAIPEEWDSIDVYGVCKLFPIDDPTGCIHHSLKKLLVPGVRTGGKSFRSDIKEARDTLTRWLELNPE